MWTLWELCSDQKLQIIITRVVSEQSEETDPPELRHRCHRPLCYPGDGDTCGGRTHLQRGRVHHWTPVSDRYDSNNTEDCDLFSQTSQTNGIEHVNEGHASCFPPPQVFMLSYANSCWLQLLIWCTHSRIILSRPAGLLSGVDLVEVNPLRGQTEQDVQSTVSTAVDLLLGCFGRRREGNHPTDYRLPEP